MAGRRLKRQNVIPVGKSLLTFSRAPVRLNLASVRTSGARAASFLRKTRHDQL
jgi:hypothetical protein